MAVFYGEDRLHLEAAGDVSVDRKGLWTGACRFRVRPGRHDLVPGPNTEHPMLWFLWAERSRLVFTPGLWTVVVEYAGTDRDVSEADYDLNPGVGSDPIETHKDFVSRLAGTPKTPKNGAVFIDPRTGDVTASMEAGKFQFDRFAEVIGPESNPVENELAGLRSYLVANNTVWTKSWTQRVQPAAGNRALQVVDKPDGPAPSFSGHNWLEHPVAATRRGGAWACTQRWLLSGPKGWSKRVYSDA